jgi:hypothetical protein
MNKWLPTLALILCIPAQADTVYPTLQIANDQVRATLYLPDADKGYYRGTRFDWSGVIQQVEHAGHTFYAPLYPTHDPTVHDSISGPAGEFAMSHPMGFAEAKPGETFVKIGVGLLEKGASDEYQFAGDYRLVRAGEWRIEPGPDRVRFTQQLTGDRGWGYRYEKTVRLVPGRPELVIEQRLENTGEKTIDIDHYNHNFTLIDGLAYGPSYSVEFPFAADEPRPINGLAHFRGNRIIVDRPLRAESLWMPVFEGDGSAADNAATVRNDQTGASVRFQGDAAITKMVFWAVERAACPEPFVAIKLAPGQAKRWSSTYTYAAGD